jgi:hypothetical protein
MPFFFYRTLYAQEIRTLTNGIVSNFKTFSQQKKKLPEPRDNSHNRRKSLPAIQQIKD